MRLRAVGHRQAAQHRPPERRSQGGTNALTNLLTFLGLGDGSTGDDDHHRRIDTRIDPTDEARGLTVRSWQDPARIPVVIATEAGPVAYWLTPDGRYAEQGPGEAA